jgi:hypothetical protein
MRKLCFGVVVTVGGCSGDDSSDLTCGAIPKCYQDAVVALRACVASPSLTLGTPTNNSGVVENLMCSGTNQSVAFSTFSFSPNGTVPLPSSTTLSLGGATCATVKRSEGVKEMGDGTKQFVAATIEIPGAAEIVTVNRYNDNTVGIECGPTEVTAAGSSLTSCAAQILSPVVMRDDAITTMTMELIDMAGASTTLFACTR